MPLATQLSSSVLMWVTVTLVALDALIMLALLPGRKGEWDDEIYVRSIVRRLRQSLTDPRVYLVLVSHVMLLIFIFGYLVFPAPARARLAPLPTASSNADVAVARLDAAIRAQGQSIDRLGEAMRSRVATQAPSAVTGQSNSGQTGAGPSDRGGVDPDFPWTRTGAFIAVSLFVGTYLVQRGARGITRLVDAFPGIFRGRR